MNGILQWKVPSCQRVPAYKQSLLFMRIVVIENLELTINYSKKVHLRMTCVVLMNTAYFPGLVPKLIKSLKKNLSPTSPTLTCPAVFKKCTFKTMTLWKDESLWGIRSPAKNSHLKRLLFEFLRSSGGNQSYQSLQGGDWWRDDKGKKKKSYNHW